MKFKNFAGSIAAVALGALLGVGAIGIAEATNLIRSVTLVNCNNGDLHSDTPAGGACGGSYIALAWQLSTRLADCGIETMQHGTPFSCSITRGTHLTGTNEDTVAITVTSVSGDDFAAAGGVAPGTGNDLTFSSVDNTDKSGLIQLCADDGTSQDCSASKNWALFASTPPTSRDLYFESDFESGKMNAVDFQNAQGVYKDAGNVHQAGIVDQITITNITTDTQAVMTWSNENGAPDPARYEGITLSESGGIPQLRGRLVMCEADSYNSIANTCLLQRTGDYEGKYGAAAGCNNCQVVCDGTSHDSDFTSGVSLYNNCENVNSSTYTDWSGGDIVGYTWERHETQNGGLAPSAPQDSKVIRSPAGSVTEKFTPPTTLEGTAQQETCLLGQYCFAAPVYYWRAHDTFQGNGQKNKVRMIAYAGNGGSPIPINYDEEACMSVGILLPSNYDSHDRAGALNATDDQLIVLAPLNDENHEVNIGLNGGAGNIDRWSIRYYPGPGAAEQFVDMGPVTNDLGLWTVFTIQHNRDDDSTGKLKVWKSTGPVIGPGVHERADTRYLNYTGPFGRITDPFPQAAKFQLRRYKYGWHHQLNTTPSTTSAAYFDEWRVTRFVADGGDCSDVHPFRHVLN
jgi:hypothetical protein